MTKLELENIISQINNLKNSPNSVIINNLDLLSSEFETTKNNIIQLTYHLDKIEELLFIDCKYRNTRKTHIDSAHWFADEAVLKAGEREDFSMN